MQQAGKIMILLDIAFEKAWAYGAGPFAAKPVTTLLEKAFHKIWEFVCGNLC